MHVDNCGFFSCELYGSFFSVKYTHQIKISSLFLPTKNQKPTTQMKLLNHMLKSKFLSGNLFNTSFLVLQIVHSHKMKQKMSTIHMQIQMLFHHRKQVLIDHYLSHRRQNELMMKVSMFFFTTDDQLKHFYHLFLHSASIKHGL